MSSVFFLLFLENDLETRQNPSVDSFKARKDFEGFKTAFSIYCGLVLCSLD